MVATPSIDNSEWVMQGVIRDPQTGALLRVNADGSINVSGGGGGGVGTGTTITGGASITLNSTGVQFNGSGLAGTVTAATNATLTLNSAGLSISVAAPGAATNAVGLNTAQTNVTWTVNSSGISFNAGGYNGTGFTSATTAGAAIVATNNTAGLSVGVPVFLTTADLSQNSSLYAGLGTSATNASVTLNTAGLAISVGASAAGGTISSFQNFPLVNNSGLNSASILQSTSWGVSFEMPQNISFSFLRMPALMTTSSITIAANASITTGAGFIYSTWLAAIYSMGTGANSQSLQYVTSGGNSWTQMNSYSAGGGANSTLWSVTGAFTAHVAGNAATVGTSTQHSQSTVSVNISSDYLTNFSSLRFLDIDFVGSLTPGPYWLFIGQSTSTTTSGQGAANMTLGQARFQNIYVATQINSWFPQMGDTAANTGGWLGAAKYSNAGGASTSSIALSLITSIPNNQLIVFQLIRSA